MNTLSLVLATTVYIDIQNKTPISIQNHCQNMRAEHRQAIEEMKRENRDEIEEMKKELSEIKRKINQDFQNAGATQMETEEQSYEWKKERENILKSFTRATAIYRFLGLFLN